MNSLSGKPSNRGPSAPSPVSLNSYQFDFDLGLSGRAGAASSRPLRDQKPSPSPIPSSAYAGPNPAAGSKPSWTHAPAPAPRSGGIAAPPSSMVGDIFGKSWSPAPAPAPASVPSSTARLGIPNNNPNLFGDLLGSALGAAASKSSAVPLKASAPRNSYSMGSLSDSLPKTTAPAATSTTTTTTNPMKSSWKSAENLNTYSAAKAPMKSSSTAAPLNNATRKDPFDSLSGFGSKSTPMSSAKSPNSDGGRQSYSFGEFQNAKVDGFVKPPAQTFATQPPPVQAQADPLDMLFGASASAAPEAAGTNEMNDWEVQFGGNEGGGGATTELEGLPPPPAGVTASSAKTKGSDHYKQGQYADAIRWLTWAVVLFDKSGDSAATAEVLVCRASCYKEVGEYKKAVADCSKVLEHDGTNVAVLLQRALLYESTEKYRLGAEDLRMVLKIDPGNRLARSTIHRLNKLAD